MTPPLFTRRSVLTLPLLSAVFAHPGLSQEASPDPSTGPAGNWLMTGANAARTGATAGPGLTSAPVERWRIPSDLSQQAATLGPLITGDTAFMWSDGDQRLHAYDLNSGTERWQADAGSVLQNGPDFAAVIGDGVLYVFGTAGEASSSDASAPLALFAMDLATGQERWRVSYSEELYVSVPLLVGSLLVFAEQGPSGAAVSALDMAGGQQVWRADLPSPFGEPSPVASSGDTLFVAAGTFDQSPGGVLIALETATGTERWQVPTAGSPRVGPVVADGIVAIALFTDDPSGIAVQTLAADTGAEQWRGTGDYSADGVTFELDRIAAAHRLVYLDVTTETQSGAGYSLTNSIVALDGATGTQQWRALDLDMPVVAGEVLYATTFDIMTDADAQPALVGLNALSGEELWRVPGQARVMAAGANVLLVESHGAVIAYGLP